MYEAAYATEKFVTLLPELQLPETSSLIGSNSAHLQVACDPHSSRAVISIAIDNLGKGAAGQAIQNANLISGLPEDSGLPVMGIGQ
jgi:N-acetyl-gamma-glutamyl-phosphate reductase